MYVASIQFLSEFAIQAITKPSADTLKPVCHTRGYIQMFEVFETWSKLVIGLLPEINCFQSDQFNLLELMSKPAIPSYPHTY